MRNLSFTFMVFMLAAGTANAACYADYKAKQDGPLRLHYGVVEVRGECSAGSAADQLRDALARDGWQLLNVLGVFDEAGLDGRKDAAGEYFLRY
ncbi:hypothetical protein [Yoonia sp. SS1-5]|uniref:DUF4177 domain-containing protein n=1 Tax=Yoonia rhodophyticola TaxID=3137370 RepID=A0AAN0MAR2_9RHOB